MLPKWFELDRKSDEESTTKKRITRRAQMENSVDFKSTPYLFVDKVSIET